MKILQRLLRRRALYDDLHEEIRAHIDERTDALIAQGMSPADARAAARRAFGNVTTIQEDGRAAWEWPTLESFLKDVRYALRQLRRAPAVTTIIVLTMALGIAATTTVFSWTRSVLLDPLPGAAEPDRVLAIESTTASGTFTATSWLDYRDYRDHLRLFEGLAASLPVAVSLGDDRQAERIPGELVSANFFDVLGVRAAAGRFFARELDDAEGGQPSVVISYALWQRRWQGNPAVIGEVVHINRFPFTVIGVAPESFHGSMPGERIDAWVPATMLGQIVPTGGWWLRDRGTRTFRVLARLGDGVTIPAARADVEALARRLAEANADIDQGMGGALLPLWQSHWGVQDGLRTPLLVLLAACGLVLLIVCANSANLLLARASVRRRELSMRLALGAPRHRLLRQLLTEASILAVAGATLGLLGTVWLSRTLRLLVPAFASPTLLEPRVDLHVLAFTVVLAMLVTLLAGIAPALHASRDALGDTVREGGRAAGGSAATRLRRSLVVAEMALAVVALVGAGLFAQSVRHARGVQPGFETDGVAIGTLSLTLAGYDSAHAQTFLSAVVEQLRRVPGVTDASYTDYVPLSVGSGSWEELRIEGYAPERTENMKLFRAAIGPDYLRVMRIPLLQGRDFRTDDDSAHAAVMIVNESFVQRYLHGRAALGTRVHGWGRWFTIVGVARDVKHYRVTDPPTPYFYVPVRQVYRPEYGYTFVARTRGSVDELTRAIPGAVHAVDPSVAVSNAMSLGTYVQGPLQGEAAATQLLGILAAVAALLAAIGMYGVIAYAVAQRTREFGVRIALGARAVDVVRTVASEASGLLMIGVVIGLLGAAALARVMASLLFGMGAADLVVFVAAAVLMGMVSFVAIFIPARRAARVDAMVALRSE